MTQTVQYRHARTQLVGADGCGGRRFQRFVYRLIWAVKHCHILNNRRQRRKPRILSNDAIGLKIHSLYLEDEKRIIDVKRVVNSALPKFDPIER